MPGGAQWAEWRVTGCRGRSGNWWPRRGLQVWCGVVAAVYTGGRRNHWDQFETWGQFWQPFGRFTGVDYWQQISVFVVLHIVITLRNHSYRLPNLATMVSCRCLKRYQVIRGDGQRPTVLLFRWRHRGAWCTITKQTRILGFLVPADTDCECLYLFQCLWYWFSNILVCKVISTHPVWLQRYCPNIFTCK